MQQVEWDLAPYVGKKLYLKVVDQSTIGWGRITVDDFQFDAKAPEESPDINPPAEAKSPETGSVPTNSKALRHPNFVVIFTDDQGYGNLRCFGGKHVRTPRIDRMAAEGA